MPPRILTSRLGSAECAERLNTPYPTGVLACAEFCTTSWPNLPGSCRRATLRGRCAFRRAVTWSSTFSPFCALFVWWFFGLVFYHFPAPKMTPKNHKIHQKSHFWASFFEGRLSGVNFHRFFMNFHVFLHRIFKEILHWISDVFCIEILLEISCFLTFCRKTWNLKIISFIYK